MNTPTTVRVLTVAASVLLLFGASPHAGAAPSGRAPAATAPAYDDADRGDNSTADWFDCSGLVDGNYPNPNADDHYIACVAQEHAYSMPCAMGHDGQRLHYVRDSGPDPAKSRCDYAEIAGGTSTDLTARPAALSTDRSAVTGLSAYVRGDGTFPVHGARVVFTDGDGRVLCTAYTGIDGTAACQTVQLPAGTADRAAAIAALAHGYTATYAGGGSGSEGGGWQGSTGRAPVTTA